MSVSPTELFVTVESNLQRYKKMMGQASDSIIENNVSNYPIFLVHKQILDMGILLIDHRNSPSIWSIHASSLEEFVTKQIVENDKIEEFRKVYKSPKDFLCLFVLSEVGATFVFLPRI